MIHPWPTTNTKPSGDYRIFSIRTDLKVSPRTGQAHEFYIIDSTNWVNVIALTPDHKIVMVEQYRHGSNTVELEIPGGIIDPEDASPLAAGLRELREETGYEGVNPRVIGDIYPNPAIMSNTCYTVFVENCQIKHSLKFDQTEDILTRLVPVSEIPTLIAQGKIRHSLVVVALYYFELSQHRTASIPV